MRVNRVSTEKYGNFDRFWQNLAPFDPRPDFQFGHRGEIFFSKHSLTLIDSDLLTSKPLETEITASNFEKRRKTLKNR